MYVHVHVYNVHVHVHVQGAVKHEPSALVKLNILNADFHIEYMYMYF